MEHVYKYLKQYGSRIQKGPEYVLAAIWGGYGVLDKIDRRGLKAVMDDPRVNDCGPGQTPGNGCVSFGQYVKLLGKDAGRRYSSSVSRAEKVKTPIHTASRTGCSLCQQIRDSGSIFIPHEAS
jgi:hypothetical protein